MGLLGRVLENPVHTQKVPFIGCKKPKFPNAAPLGTSSLIKQQRTTGTLLVEHPSIAVRFGYV
jgi:hypothetical protein